MVLLMEDEIIRGGTVRDRLDLVCAACTRRGCRVSVFNAVARYRKGKMLQSLIHILKIVK